jgi:small-conductance mechanosensitive channel
MARLVQTSILVLGFLIALSVVAPSFKAADLIKLLGVGTVAIGFAFQNILQNFLAGILRLFAGTVSARGLYQCHRHRRNSL